MSALRISRPGIPGTTLIDLGPSVARLTHGGTGGSLVTGQKPRPLPVAATTPERRKQMAEYRAKVAKPCGRWIILARAECARNRQHKGSCTTAERLRKQAEAR